MRVFIILICAIGALLCGLELAYSTEIDGRNFTTDERSVLHFGAGALIGAGTRAVAGKATWKTYLAAGVLSGIAGTAKELSDPVFDYGDLGWTVLGAPVGVYIGDKTIIYFKKNFVGVKGEW